MLNIEKVNLTNIVTYKDQDFRFEPGLTIVKGENRAGKSLLFSSLANLLYFSHPLSDKKDAKAILTARDQEVDKKAASSSITLDISKGDQKYTIKQKAAKESITYQIQENGIDLDSRTIALSKDLIEGIFTQPEDIFYTSTYLTSYRNHPLLHGSTAQRYEFFEKLFNFDFFDFLYEKFNLEVKDLESKKVELGNLESLLLDLPSKQQELEKNSKELEIVQARRDVLQAGLSALTHLRMEIIRLLDVQGDLDKVVSTLNTVKVAADQISKGQTDIDALIQSLEASYSSLLESEKNSKLIQSKTQEVSTVKANIEQAKILLQPKETQVEVIRNRLDISKESLTAEGLRNTITNNQEIVNKAQSELQGKTLEQWQVVHSKAVELEQLTADNLQITLAEVKGLTEEACNKEIAKLQEQQATQRLIISDTEGKLEKISKLSSGTVQIHTAEVNHDKINCPTCLSELSSEQIRTYKGELEETLKVANNILVSTADRLTNYTRYLKCLSFMKTAISLEVAEQGIKTISKAQTETLLVKEALVALSAYEDSKRNLDYLLANQSTLEGQLLEMAKLVSEDSVFSVDTSDTVRQQIDLLKNLKKAQADKEVVATKVSTKIKDIVSLVQAESYLQTIPTLDLTPETLGTILPKIQAYLEVRISEHTNENTGLQSSLTNASVAVAFLRKEIAQLEQHRNKVATLRIDLQQYDTVTKLAKVFHSKGFRLEKIKYFTQVFEATLNRYSGFLFMEPFTFSISMEKRDLQIIASRAGRQSDVRYLSGSESRCFQLLCLISILSLLPSNKRTNVCILDEMDAGCDESTTQMFYERFLPELRAIVPSIVVITPLKDNGFYINEDRSYMIRKVAGMSKAELLTN